MVVREPNEDYFHEDRLKFGVDLFARMRSVGKLARWEAESGIEAGSGNSFKTPFVLSIAFRI